MDQIIIHGARQHNLKNISLTIPRNKFVVITGVSGSGKSSLAFDTIFTEGRRRYFEAASAHAGYFSQRLGAPAVDKIEGLSPTIAVEQKAMPRNPRSTVGTLTEINDFLRLLYARLGVPHCPVCSIPIRAGTIEQILAEVSALQPSGTRLFILAPLSPVKERDLSKTVGKLKREGYSRIRVEGIVYELDPPPRLPRRASYTMEVLVDRIILGEGKLKRLSDSLELALKIGRGVAGVFTPEGVGTYFSEHRRCMQCGYEAPEPTPSLFSFHHPLGACPTCGGLGFAAAEKTALKGERGRIDPKKLAAPDSLSDDSSIDPDSAAAANELPCPDCRGTRLNQAARSFFLGDDAIHDLCGLPASSLKNRLATLNLSPTESAVAAIPIQEILKRLDSLEQLGLSYLRLDRSAPTLSGGEVQRIMLSRQIGAGLSGVLYVLDEPSVGLHPRDHQRLLDILFKLRDEGNSVIVVEHDMQTILQADYLVDMGPGAGTLGGEVVFAGKPEEAMKADKSLTGQYLGGNLSIPVPSHRRKAFTKGAIRISGARARNLKGISVEIPIGCLTCVTGVSGSGKSTLIIHTLYRALARILYGSAASPGAHDGIEGIEIFRRAVLIDQSPIGRTPRSTPATYSGVFDPIRELYSHLPESRARGFGPARFSFNAKGGRCEICKGEGVRKIDMFFLPDVFVTCPACEGRRYGKELLEILFKGMSIASVLEMTVSEACALFESFPKIRNKLNTLVEVGLGYIRLGMPAATLSGGEAQRVKLAAELAGQGPGKALYILDEPTTGLHFDDIQKLLHVLQKLIDLGHTVVLIEHHPDVVKTADHVIDLGPEGGEGGGYVTAAGAPEEIASTPASFTGMYLRRVLKRAAPTDASPRRA